MLSIIMDILTLKTRRLKYLFRQELERLSSDIYDGGFQIFEACDYIRPHFEKLGFDPSVTDPILESFEDLTLDDDCTQFIEFFTCMNIILKLPILNKQNEILDSFFYNILKQDLDNLESFKHLSISINKAGFKVDPDKSIRIRTDFFRRGGKYKTKRRSRK